MYKYSNHTRIHYNHTDRVSCSQPEICCLLSPVENCSPAVTAKQWKTGCWLHKTNADQLVRNTFVRHAAIASSGQEWSVVMDSRKHLLCRLLP